jgi:hypothetical protein
VLEGASVVMDAANSPSFEDAAALNFFETSTGTDPQARYYGVILSERTLLPGADALVAETRFQGWLEQQLATA